MEPLVVGHRIRRRDVLGMVPPGTMIREVNNPSRAWTKTESGAWAAVNGGPTFADEAFSLRGVNEIAALPDGRNEWMPPSKTVQQVKHAYRSGALAAAVAHGVNVDTVEEALVEMGCGPELDLPVGRGVMITSGDNHPKIPAGTVAFCGNTARPDTMGVFRWSGSVWVHLLGGRSWVENTMVVESVNGSTERPAWLDEVGTEKDEAAIAEFKATAWRVGYKLKRSQHWCGTYEEIVHGLGVSQADVRASRYNGFARGQRITRDEARSLPNGSVLWWQHSADESQFAVYVRRDEAANRAGTVRAFASEGVTDNENCKQYMTVAGIHQGDELGSDFDLAPYRSVRVFPLLPAGTRFRQQNDGESEFVKCVDGKVAQAGRPHTGTGPWTYPESFNGAELIVVMIP